MWRLLDSLDPPTVFAVAAVIALFLGSATLWVRITAGREYPGVGRWALATLPYAMGCGLLAQRGLDQDPAVMMAVETLLLLPLLLIQDGAADFFGLARRRLQGGVALVAVLGGQAILRPVLGDFSALNVGFSGGLLWLSIDAARTVRRGAARLALAPGHLLSLLLIGNAALVVVRAVARELGPGAGRSFLGSGGLVGVLTIMAVAGLVPFYLSLLVMHSERRRHDLIETRQVLKELRELVPVCAWCGQIHGISGAWESVDAYIRRHFDVEVSHGICPPCLTKMDAALEDDYPAPE